MCLDKSNLARPSDCYSSDANFMENIHIEFFVPVLNNKQSNLSSDFWCRPCVISSPWTVQYSLEVIISIDCFKKFGWFPLWKQYT